MRLILFTALLFLCIAATAQQRAATFQDAAKDNITVKLLDKKYMNALDADSNKSVFKGAGQKQFVDAYVALLTAVSAYLHKNNFMWGKPVRIVHRIYFEPDGTIDHYLLNLDATKIDNVKKDRLIYLLNQFVSNYKLKIHADKKFAQCGPAVYQD